MPLGTWSSSGSLHVGLLPADGKSWVALLEEGDTDGDGYLSMEELRILVRRVGNYRLRGQVARTQVEGAEFSADAIRKFCGPHRGLHNPWLEVRRNLRVPVLTLTDHDLSARGECGEALGAGWPHSALEPSDIRTKPSCT